MRPSRVRSSRASHARLSSFLLLRTPATQATQNTNLCLSSFSRHDRVFQLLNLFQAKSLDVITVRLLRLKYWIQFQRQN